VHVTDIPLLPLITLRDWPGWLAVTAAFAAGWAVRAAWLRHRRG
jgi:hypothetical protein